MVGNKSVQQSTLKIHNKKAILYYIMKNGAFSRADLAAALDSTKPTISKNVNELLEEGIIIEIGKGSNQIGKKSILLDLNPDLEHFLVINLAGNIFSLSIYNLKNEKLYELMIDMPNKFDIINILEKSVAVVGTKNILKKCILSIPAVVHGERITSNIKNYVDTYNFINDFCQRENIELFVENDLDLQGEYLLSNMKDENGNFILVGSNYGIGSSVFINGKIYQGSNKFAGEIGFFNPYFKNDVLENLENRCSFGGMVKKYYQDCGVSLNKESFIKEVRTGNILLNKYIEDMIEELYIAIFNMSYMFDINNIILTGTLFELKEDIVDTIQEKINVVSEKTIKVSKSNEATKSIDGALLVARREILKLY
ncbi:MAG: ROK family protein [Lachnospirales bacterium]